MMTEREILTEIATALYLLITFSKPAPGCSWDDLDEDVLATIQKKAEAALREAEPFVGVLNAETVKEFMADRREKMKSYCPTLPIPPPPTPPQRQP